MGMIQNKVYPLYFSSGYRMKFSVKYENFSPDLCLGWEEYFLQREKSLLRVASVAVADGDAPSIWLQKIIYFLYGDAYTAQVSNAAAFLSFAKFWKEMTFLLSLRRVDVCLANCTEKIR